MLLQNYQLMGDECTPTTEIKDVSVVEDGILSSPQKKRIIKKVAPVFSIADAEAREAPINLLYCS